MCIIIHKPADRKISEKTLENAIDNNGDGWGFSWRTERGGPIEVARGMESAAFVAMAKSLEPYEYLAHCRIATSGMVDERNLHPFIVPQQDVGPVYMMHNGIINIAKPQAEYSDTWHFVQELGNYDSKLADDLKRRNFRRRLKNLIGKSNKLAFMTPYRVHIINAEAGVWADGCWYSNNSAFYTYNKAPGRAYTISDFDSDWEEWDKVHKFGASPWGGYPPIKGTAVKAATQTAIVGGCSGPQDKMLVSSDNIAGLTAQQQAARNVLANFLQRHGEDVEVEGEDDDYDENDTPTFRGPGGNIGSASWSIAREWISGYSANLLTTAQIESDIYQDPEACALAILRIIRKDVL